MLSRLPVGYTDYSMYRLKATQNTSDDGKMMK